jgi:hypothetical protein
MFRHPFTSRRLIALLLPLVFLWSWAACAALCSEVAVHHHDSLNPVKPIVSASDCLTQNTEADGCSMTGETVVVSERQNDKASQVAVDETSISAFRAPAVGFSARLPEIRQNSPPQSFSPPLLAFLCTFRI